MASVIRRGVVVDENMTLNKYVTEIWLKKVEKEIKPTTFWRYKGLLTRILDALGYMKIFQIQPPQIRAFFDDLYEETRGMRNIRQSRYASFARAVIFFRSSFMKYYPEKKRRI